MANEKTRIKPKQYCQPNRNIDRKIVANFIRQRECDVHFTVGQKRVRMSAHKSVLISLCHAFERLIAKVDGRVSCNIPNISPDNFKSMLRFIYGFSLTITESNMIQLNSIAQKYEIDTLCNCCRDYYVRVIDKDNALKFLCSGVAAQESDLIKYCLKIVDQNAYEMIVSEEFFKLNWKLVAMILERDQLNVKEIDLLKALIKWAQHQCNEYNIEVNGDNLLKMIDSCLYLIRFPLINVVDIIECLSNYGLCNALLHKTFYQRLLNKMSTKKRAFNPIFKTNNSKKY